MPHLRELLWLGFPSLWKTMSNCTENSKRTKSRGPKNLLVSDIILMIWPQASKMAASFSSFHSISSWSWRACSTFSEWETNQDGKYLPTTTQSGFRGGFLDEKHNNINWPCPEHCQMFQLYQYPWSIRYAETLHFSTNILFWEDLRKTLETVVLIFLKFCFDVLIRGVPERTYQATYEQCFVNETELGQYLTDFSSAQVT